MRVMSTAAPKISRSAPALSEIFLKPSERGGINKRSSRRAPGLLTLLCLLACSSAVALLMSGQGAVPASSAPAEPTAPAEPATPAAPTPQAEVRPLKPIRRKSEPAQVASSSLTHLTSSPSASEESSPVVRPTPWLRQSSSSRRASSYYRDDASTSSPTPSQSLLLPPTPRRSRPSSIISYASDSRYPLPYFNEAHDSPLSPRPVSLYYDDQPGTPTSPRFDSPSEPAFDMQELLSTHRDADDAIDEAADQKHSRTHVSFGGACNILTLVIIAAVILGLFAVFPMVEFLSNNPVRERISHNTQVNSTGQVPVARNVPSRSLIDLETPLDARSRIGFDGQEYELVFSDEFNDPNRTFFPGDDPFWEAVDLWYGVTQDLEWYDPGQITTGDGKLRIKLEKVDARTNHNLTLKSGMLQSWNKFCFTSGYIEIAAQLPGSSNTAGYWPGAWLMGNLGRAGYPATTDGLWPYSYDSCDVGAFPNQTYLDRSGPAAALNVPAPYGRTGNNFELSWLPGQRLSSCTCAGEDHPGPRVDDNTRFRGRGAPEIDIIEAQKCPTRAGGCASQSAQFAPFNEQYAPDLQGVRVHAPGAELNGYRGSPTQQAMSALTQLSDNDYAESSSGQYGVFGMEYLSSPADPSQAYISWVADEQRTWTMTGASIGGDAGADISQRLISQEPMSIVFNLGVSHSFQTFNVEDLNFPAEFLIDYVRVYQRVNDPGASLGCSPSQYPTAKYIEQHFDAYDNPQLTSWEATGYSKPRSSKIDNCSPT